MLTDERKQFLLDRLKRDGRLVAKSVSRELSLSEDTIRRDLRELAAEGLLQRVHGGALPASPTVVSLDSRRAMAVDEKHALGRAAAPLVMAHQTVFVDGGTTNLELVRNIPLDLRCRIVTHSPIIAAALEAHAADVVLIGGTLYRHSMVCVGAATREAIDLIRTDLAFVGLTGLHPAEGGTTGDYEEATIKRAIIARAAETVVMLTADKIGAVSANTVCALGDISRIVVCRAVQLNHFPSDGPEVLRA
jgi:DeoR/GlpR family transcriptional regulator of sugar metabolism